MIVSIDRPHLPPVVPFRLSSPLFQCRHHSVHRLSRSCLFFGRSPAAGFSWPLFIGRSGCHPDIGYFWPPLLQSMLFFGKSGHSDCCDCVSPAASFRSSFPIFGRRLPAIQPLLRHAIWPSMSIRHCQRSVSPTASESVCDISVVLGNFSGCHSHSLSGRCRYYNRHRYGHCSDHCSDRVPATPRSLSDLRPLLILSGHLHLCVLCCLSSFSPYRSALRKSVPLCLDRCPVVGGSAPAI